MHDYGQIPLAFEPNLGQADKSVDFFAHGPDYGIFLTSTEAVLELHAHGAPADPFASDPSAASSGLVLRLQLVGSNAGTQAVGQGAIETRTNYLLGNDPSQWITNVPNFGQVTYQNVYPGVDLVYHGSSQQQLEFDFVVHPGADPGAIRLAPQGAQSLSLDAQGNLVLTTPYGNLVEQAPVVLQDNHGTQQAVTGRYVLLAGGQVGFQLGAYDPSLPLRIDPALGYSSYLGGGLGDVGNGVAVDANNYAYLTGMTYSTNFPTTTGAYQTHSANMSTSMSDVFVTKVNATGTALVWSTYLGGGFEDIGNAIAVDSSGVSYITGWTASTNFPTTSNAYQLHKADNTSATDVFVTKLSADGSSLLYSTYLGGTLNDDHGYAIAVDSSGNAYLGGDTYCTNFPVASAYQSTQAGNSNAFIAKFSSSGSLVYSTYLGGANYNRIRGLVLDGSGNIVVVGNTNATNFPLANAVQSSNAGGYDAFVTKLNSSGSALGSV
jgi:hypothetical protein